MEGFTSSLHVKGATAKRVQDAITDLLSAEGFVVLNAETTEPDDAAAQLTRGVWVAHTKGDWVSVFCSDFMFQQEIGRELSKQLQTHTLNVWITEGSSWHYSLFHNGEEVDQFDSSGEPDELQDFLDADMDELAEEFDDDEDDLNAVAEDEDDENGNEFQARLNRIAALQEQISAQMPEDVRAVYERLNDGTASLKDMRRFDQWSQANHEALTRFQDELQQQTAELTATMQGVLGPEDQADSADPSQLLGQNLPPELAELFGRVLSGQASADELARFAEKYAGSDEDEDEEDEVSSDPLLTAGNGDAEAGMNGAGSDHDDEDDEDDELYDDESTGISEQRLQVHLGALRPLLSKDIDSDEVAETLTSQDDAPEQPLGDLLTMLGIDPLLSDLDFDALENLDSADLSAQGIKLSPLLLVRSG